MAGTSDRFKTRTSFGFGLYGEQSACSVPGSEDLSPAAMAHNLDESRNWVSNRLSSLDQAELGDETGPSNYSLADMEEDYPSGDLETDDLPEFEID